LRKICESYQLTAKPPKIFIQATIRQAVNEFVKMATISHLNAEVLIRNGSSSSRADPL
jgi:hypothetical protein